MTRETGVMGAIEAPINNSKGCGGLMRLVPVGLLLGKNAVPADWLEELELRCEVEEIAQDLITGFRDDPNWWEKYPGWRQTSIVNFQAMLFCKCPLGTVVLPALNLSYHLSRRQL